MRADERPSDRPNGLADEREGISRFQEKLTFVCCDDGGGEHRKKKLGEEEEEERAFLRFPPSKL
jgi:hypothetical protein